MALSMKQAYALQGMGSLGYVQAIAAIVGPLAQGGADIYKTSSDSKQNRKELKQRQREFQAMLPILEGQQAVYAPYLLGAVAIGGLALVAIAVTKEKK